VDDVRTYERLSLAPVGELRAILGELDLLGRRIGMELGRDQRLGIPVVELERIRAELAPTRFEDAALLLWRLRRIKSATDTTSFREACRITGEAYAAAFGGSRAGDLDRDVAQGLIAAMTARGGRDPWVLVTSGAGNYELATGAPAGRALEPGDMIWFDIGCSMHGFWSDFSRAAVIGPPSAEQLEAQHLVIEATRAGLDLVAPGVPVAAVAAACNRGMASLGLPVVARISDLAGRVGHGIGYDVTEPPDVAETDETILEAGMVISVEPGFATEYGLFHVEQNVLVTPNGHELLSTAPTELVTIPLS
jgi:Xaa-Pro aminopeptidase